MIILALVLVILAAYMFGTVQNEIEHTKIYKPYNDYWIQQASIDPKETVRSALENQIEREYTLSIEVKEIWVDEEETKRNIKNYLGSELAETRGWTDEDLRERFIVVGAKYYVDYDGKKIFYTDGHLEQYFYLMQYKKNKKWIIVENTSACD
jgi:hypothetical protein